MDKPIPPTVTTLSTAPTGSSLPLTEDLEGRAAVMDGDWIKTGKTSVAFRENDRGYINVNDDAEGRRIGFDMRSGIVGYYDEDGDLKHEDRDAEMSAYMRDQAAQLEAAAVA